MSNWSPGQTLNNDQYKIEKELGSGGFAVTYLAYDYLKATQVVIKSPNEVVQNPRNFQKFKQYFRDEADRLKKCQSPHIVEYYDIFEEQGLCCIVMEYIDGEDLATLVSQQGPLEESTALAYIQQIGEALTFVNGLGILHRDVKPENIIKRNNQDRVVLIDFGIAREFTFNQPDSHTEYLSHGFAPPEQYFRRERRGDYTDVYALAATLYVLLTGYDPQGYHYLPRALDRGHEKIQSGRDLLQSPKNINSKISDTVNKAILKGMELDYKKRPQTVEKWLALLQPQPHPFHSLSQTVIQVVAPVTQVTKQATTQVKTLYKTLHIPGIGRLSQMVSQTNSQVIPGISYQTLIYCLGAGALILVLGIYINAPYLNKKISRPKPVTIDYKDLEKLLANKEFEEADAETLEIMLALTHRQKKGWLDIEDIKNFPCSDLEKINKLWRHYSNQRFGLTAQEWIWIDELGGETGVYDPELADKFGDLVGWRVNGKWYQDISYNLSAKPAHLPYKINVRGWDIAIPYWAERLESCNIP
jgi:serine/threonine protein kinase